MLIVLADNKESRCHSMHKMLIVDAESKEAFIYSMVLCSSGGGGWVTKWDGSPTDRAMEVLKFIYGS